MKRKLIMLALTMTLFVAVVVGLNVTHAEGTFEWYPRLGNVTTDGVEVVFLTGAETDSYIQYGLKADYDAGKGFTGKTDSKKGKLFRIPVKGLMSNSQYVYQVVVNGAPTSEVRSFFTAPTTPIEFTFLAYGDTRSHQEKHQLLADKMAVDPTNPRFTIHVGDLVTNGGEKNQWLEYAPAIKELAGNMPYYAAIGNHEYNSNNYYDNLALPENGGGQRNSEWYSFDYAGVHFIVLDTNIMDKYVNDNVPNAVEKQYEWMLKDLEANKDAKWIVAVFHHPIYSSHYRSRYPRLQEEWIPIFDKYGVDLVLNGHNHIYERVLSGGRNYITTGGGGAPFDYVTDYEPRVEGSVSLSDAMLQYVRVRVTADKLYVETVQTHDEADDFVSLVDDMKIIDSVEIEEIKPKK